MVTKASAILLLLGTHLTLIAQPYVIDPTFDTGNGFNGQGVEALVVQSNGKVICGGAFVDVNGVPRKDLVRLNTNGSVDGTFDALIDDSMVDNVFDLYLGANGKVLAAGHFSSLNGQTFEGLVRLNGNGSVDNTFLPSTQGFLFATAESGGYVFGGGGYVVPLTNMVVYDAGGSTVVQNITTLSPLCFVVQPDGKVIAGGESATTCVHRFEQNGTVDMGFQSQVTGGGYLVKDMALLADGRMLIVGDFATVDGQPRRDIARLLPDGSLDPTFDPGTGFNAWVCHAVDTLPGGGYLVSTEAGTYNGIALNGGLVQLDADGTYITSYAINTVNEIVTQPNGTVYVGGHQFKGVQRLMPDPSTTVAPHRVDAPVFLLWRNGAGYSLRWGVPGPAEVDWMDASGRLLFREMLNGPEDRSRFVPDEGLCIVRLRDATGTERMTRTVVRP